MDSIWDSFVAKYNEPPPNAFKLVNYSRSNQKLATLTYKEAKQLIDQYGKRNVNTISLKSSANEYEARRHSSRSTVAQQIKRRKSSYTKPLKLSESKHKHKHKRGRSNKFMSSKRAFSQHKLNKKPPNISISMLDNADTDSTDIDTDTDTDTDMDTHTKDKQIILPRLGRLKKAATPQPSKTNRNVHMNYNMEHINTKKRTRLLSKPAVIRSKSRPKHPKKHTRKRSSTFGTKRKSKKFQKPRPINMHKVNKPSDVKIGDHVLLTHNREGIILYIGQVHFAKGIWFGLELLHNRVGTHDGIIGQNRYFKSAPKRGLFVQESKIRRKLSQVDGPVLPFSDSGLVTSPQISVSASTNVVMSEMDIITLKSLLRAEIETEFESKFNELKQMLMDKKNTEDMKHKKKRKAKKRKKKRDKKKRKKKLKEKEKKTLDKLKKMERRRRSKSKSTAQQLKKSEDELIKINIKNNETEILSTDGSNMSDDYQKNSDLNITTTQSDTQSDDTQSDNDNNNNNNNNNNVYNNNSTNQVRNHGRNISLVSNSSNDVFTPPSVQMTDASDFDDNDIRYNINIVQQLPKRTHLWGRK